MSKKDNSPFYRPFAVIQMKPGGVEIKIEANEIERATVAADFGLPEIRSLKGEYKLSGRPEKIKVSGHIEADIQQICVVSLEPFDSFVKEEVSLVFVEEGRGGGRSAPEAETTEEGPDPIVDGQIDFGAVTLEFLALGLDPYPRKPGVSFDEFKEKLGMGDTQPEAPGDFAAGKREGGS